MIVAAGLGTRARPLSLLRPKPALPVRGLPLVAYPLAELAALGVTEVIINTHHLPGVLQAAAERHCPPGLRLSFSHEPSLLGTGGGIRRAAAFLRESDPCLILGGDMLLDSDLAGLLRIHRERKHAATLLLRDDRRGRSFGTIGVDGRGRIRRVGRRFDLGGETQAGVYCWANVVAARAFDWFPDREVFSHLDNWLLPAVAAGREDICAVVQKGPECVWEPVGTPCEYLAVNLAPPRLSYIDPDAVASRLGTRFAPGLVLGARAQIGEGAVLERAVVWDDEVVPAGFRGSDGVFAGGTFHPCGAKSEGEGA
jgi:NDP-sugar pyrophosphorylase family protein